MTGSRQHSAFCCVFGTLVEYLQLLQGSAQPPALAKLTRKNTSVDAAGRSTALQFPCDSVRFDWSAQLCNHNLSHTTSSNYAKLGCQPASTRISGLVISKFQVRIFRSAAHPRTFAVHLQPSAFVTVRWAESHRVVESQSFDNGLQPHPSRLQQLVQSHFVLTSPSCHHHLSPSRLHRDPRSRCPQFLKW